jgi:Phage ABA sandwich domain
LDDRVEAGRELDALIAEKLLGWRWFAVGAEKWIRVGLWPPEDGRHTRWNLPSSAVDVTGREQEYKRFSEWYRCGSYGNNPTTGLPHYSSDIGAAWLVVEALRQQGWLVEVKEMPDGFPFLGPDDMDPQPRIFRRACCFLHWVSTQGVDNTRRYIHLHPSGLGHTTPEAICRAALDSVELLKRWGNKED